jgi:hypothetical protein
MTKATPDTIIFVVPQTLTDNSIVYDVKIGNLTFHAVTKDDAIDLAEKMSVAIEDHTNDTTGIVYE